MKSESTDRSGVAEALESLRAELARLGERVAALEAARATPSPSPTASPAPAAEPATAVAPAVDPGIGEELVLVIGAAVAAFLGERPHIRQIRLVGSPAWAQQGRVTIQASHARPASHG